MRLHAKTPATATPLLLALVLGMAACGGGGTGSQESSSSTTSTGAHSGSTGSQSTSSRSLSTGSTPSSGSQSSSSSGSHSAPVDAAVCSFVGPAPAAPAPAGPGASQLEQATAAALSFYDGVIGQYLRGDVAVFRGTVQASAVSALSVISGPDSVTTTVPEGPALAALLVRPTITGDWFPAQPSITASGTSAVLVIHARASGEYIPYVEVEGVDGMATTAWAGGVASDSTDAGVTDDFLDSSCSGCVPSLFGHPTSLSLASATTTGVVQAFEGTVSDDGGYVSIPVQTVTSASLSLASPCSLEWADLAVLNTIIGPNEFAADIGLASWKASGGEWVSAQSGSFTISTSGLCTTVLPYTIDVYVSQTNLADHGVRDFQLGTQMQECAGVRR